MFCLGSGIEELTKFVLCISRSEGVVYFQYNKYFQAIVEAQPTASFNQLDFVLKKKLQQKSRNTTPSKPHASTEGGAPNLVSFLNQCFTGMAMLHSGPT